MKEYKFLKIARIIFKILAWVVLGLSVITGLIVLITGAPAVTPPGAEAVPQARAAGLIFILMGGFYFLLLFTISEIIGLLLDMKGASAKTV